MQNISYSRYRFPPAIIQHAVWLYYRFPLSYRDIEDLLAQRGVDVSYETVRRWALKFGQAYAPETEDNAPSSGCPWHLDEVFVSIAGKRMYLWRAVDSEGEVLDILVQSRRNKKAALKVIRKLLKKQGFVPDTFITDKLPSYGAALKDLGLIRHHDFGGRRTTEPRILTYQSDRGNDECSVSNRLDQRSGFSLPTPPSTTPSTSNAI